MLLSKLSNLPRFSARAVAGSLFAWRIRICAYEFLQLCRQNRHYLSDDCRREQLGNSTKCRIFSRKAVRSIRRACSQSASHAAPSFVAQLGSKSLNSSTQHYTDDTPAD